MPTVYKVSYFNPSEARIKDCLFFDVDKARDGATLSIPWGNIR
jgi:hypothetical protein